MATAPKRFCSGASTCPNFQGECAQHGTPSQRRDRARGTAQERGYDYAWAEYSKGWRARFPICGMRADGRIYREHSRCAQEGVTVAGEVVDHIVPMSQGGSKFNPANHQTLCRRCNTTKANTVERGNH
jgi:5-methylcytosine-specific restriction endonuclease McrA